MTMQFQDEIHLLFKLSGQYDINEFQTLFDLMDCLEEHGYTVDSNKWNSITYDVAQDFNVCIGENQVAYYKVGTRFKYLSLVAAVNKVRQELKHAK